MSGDHVVDTCGICCDGFECGWSHQWHLCQRVLGFWACASKLFPWVRAKLGCLATWSHVWWIQGHWLKCLKPSGVFGQSEVPYLWVLGFWQMEGLLNNPCNVKYHWGAFGTLFEWSSLSVPHIVTDKPCKWSDRSKCWICKWFFVALCTCVWWKCFLQFHCGPVKDSICNWSYCKLWWDWSLWLWEYTKWGGGGYDSLGHTRISRRFFPLLWSNTTCLSEMVFNLGSILRVCQFFLRMSCMGGFCGWYWVIHTRGASYGGSSSSRIVKVCFWWRNWFCSMLIVLQTQGILWVCSGPWFCGHSVQSVFLAQMHFTLSSWL